MPLASSSISSESPSQPGKRRWALPGSREGPPSTRLCPGSPASTTSSTTAVTPAINSSRRAGQDLRPAPPDSAWASATATARPRMPATSKCPGTHASLLTAAVQDRHHRDVPGQQQHAHAGRAADLVAGDRHRVGAAGAEVDGHLAERLHRVGVQRNAVCVGHRGQFADGIDRADLVVRPHHGDERDVGRVLGDGGGQRVGVHPAVVVDLEPADPGTLVGLAGTRARRARHDARPVRPGCGSGHGRPAAAPGRCRPPRDCRTRYRPR